MLSITKVLEVCVSFTSSVYLLVENIFNTCCFLGHVVVNGIIFFVEGLFRTVTNLRFLIDILCDDYSIFLSDLWTGVLTIVSGFKSVVGIVPDSFSYIISITQTFLLNIISGTVSCYEAIAHIFRLFFSFILITYNSVSYVGLSAVSLVVNLPQNLKISILFFAETIFSVLKWFLGLIYEFRTNVSLTILYFIEYLKCFLYESTYSFVGFLIGVVICITIVLNLKNIFLFSMATILKAFNGLCLIVNNCWTGEIFYRQRHPYTTESIELSTRENNRELSPPIDEPREEGLCTVCLNNSKNILFLPCRHVCVCNECSGQITSSCPICRVRIRRKLQVYL